MRATTAEHTFYQPLRRNSPIIHSLRVMMLPTRQELLHTSHHRWLPLMWCPPFSASQTILLQSVCPRVVAVDALQTVHIKWMRNWAHQKLHPNTQWRRMPMTVPIWVKAKVLGVPSCWQSPWVTIYACRLTMTIWKKKTMESMKKLSLRTSAFWHHLWHRSINHR